MAQTSQERACVGPCLQERGAKERTDRHQEITSIRLDRTAGPGQTAQCFS